MPFACSMKFRTNAQKKRLDVWLIYRCAGCAATWNLPIYERVPAGDIPPAEFQAIARNDPALAARHAFDRERVARHGGRAATSSKIAVRKLRQDGGEGDALSVQISLALAMPCQMRLDRLLSRELGVTRSQLGALHDRGALRVSPVARKALRAVAADGQTLAIDLHEGAIRPDLAATIRRRAVE